MKINLNAVIPTKGVCLKDVKRALELYESNAADVNEEFNFLYFGKILGKIVIESKCASLRCDNKKHKESVLCKCCREYVNHKKYPYYCNLLKSIYEEDISIQNETFYIKDENKSDVCVLKLYYEESADYSYIHGNYKPVTVRVDMFNFDNEEDAVNVSAIHNRGIIY